MNAFKVRLLAIFMLACMFATFPISHVQALGTIIRVTSNPPITRLCGGSWARACGLQWALNIAVPGDQIWIKAGTYRPTTGTDRTISFIIKDGVMVYGGFAGNETNFKQRDPGANVTILSGDIGVRGDIMDNSYHVVVTSGTSSTTVLDGVTITGGTSDGAIPSNYDKGAGVLNLNGSPTFRNLIITENYSENYATNPVVTHSGSGAGMYSSGNPTLEKVIFSRNQTGDTGRGGGLYSLDNPLIIDVTFKDNWAGVGGGLASMGVPTLTNVTFSTNGAYNGGGMYNASFTYGTAILTNVTFSNNTVCNNGAALYSSGSATLTNVTISGNHALKHRGGGIFMNYGTLTVTNTILWGNTALIEGSQVYVDSSATADIRYSVVEGGCPAGSSCSNIFNSDPQLATLGDNGGFTQTMALLFDSPAIDQGGNSSCPSSDQRGVSRPQNQGCDIGAYEALEPVEAGIYDDRHPAWIYNGDWTTSSRKGAYNNTLHETSFEDSYAYLTFSGVQAVLTYWAGPDHGIFDIYIDNVNVATIDANTLSLMQMTWTSPILTAGTHTVFFVVTRRGGFDLDAIQIIPQGVDAGIYDDTNSAWSYSGNWAAYTGSGPYNNTSHYTGTAGNSATIVFNGTQFMLTYAKSSSYGSIAVYVDNVLVTTLNTYSASTLWQQTYTSPTYAAGHHTVRLVHAGGGTYIDIDAIQIFGAPTPVPAGTYDDTNSAWSYSGNWLTYTGNGPYNNTTHYTGTAGDAATVVFSGTQFTLTYTKSSSYGSIEVYVDNVLVNTLSTYSATTLWQQTYTSLVYPAGTHTVRFVHAGGGTYVEVDAITILP